MTYKGTIQNLLKLGYIPNFNNEYYFKVFARNVKYKSSEWTAIFIYPDGKIVFEGVNTFKEILLNELKTKGVIIYE